MPSCPRQYNFHCNLFEIVITEVHYNILFLIYYEQCCDLHKNRKFFAEILYEIFTSFGYLTLLKTALTQRADVHQINASGQLKLGVYAETADSAD